MKALCFNKTGEPSHVLEYVEIPKPEPKPDDVRIKMMGSPINPADELFIRGKYRFKPVFPQTAGLEGMGIIDATGENTKLPLGAKAAFLSRQAWAEYCIVPKENIFLLPSDFPFEKAVQFTLNPITAWGLLENLSLKEGDWLLVTAGNSAVSKLIIQLAVKRRLKVIATVRNASYAGELKTIGASEVIDTSGELIPGKVLEVTQGTGAKGILDCVGGKTGSTLFKAAAKNSRIIIYGLLSPEATEFFNSDIIYKELTIQPFAIRTFMESLTNEQRERMVQSLVSILGEKEFVLDVSSRYPLEKYKEALSAFHQGGKTGKVIFQME